MIARAQPKMPILRNSLGRPLTATAPDCFSPQVLWRENGSFLAMKPCKRCSLGFFPTHGNQTLCASCRMGRPTTLRAGVTRTFGQRRCAVCWREFVAVSENQRFCPRRCRHLGRRRDEARYTSPVPAEHAGAWRRPWRASGVAHGGDRGHLPARGSRRRRACFRGAQTSRPHGRR